MILYPVTWVVIAIFLLIGFAILVSLYGLYGALLFILITILIGIFLFVVIEVSQRFGEWLSNL